MRKSNVCILTGMLMTAAAFGGEWPQFCGPQRNNVSTETGLAGSWPEAGPKVLWEAAVSSGYSSPSIKDGKVYLIDRDGENSVLRCLDLASGAELWKCGISDPGEMKNKKYEGTRGTPTVTDDAVYFVTGCGTLACIDLQSHEVKWKCNLVKDYNGELQQFGVAQAPFIHGNLVLVAPNAEKAGVAAYDKKSGERLWVSPNLGAYAFVNPQVAVICGQEMVLAEGSGKKPPKPRGRKKGEDAEEAPAAGSPGHVAGLSLKDGSILWDYTGWQCNVAIPGPTVVDGDRIFITGGYDAGSAMIQIVKEGEGFAAKELYKTDEVGAQLQQPIQVGNHLFIGSNSNNRNDGLCCFGIDGKLAWRTKDIEGAPNFERGPFILADGKLILLDGKSGLLYLVAADVSGYKQLASAKMVKENDMAWAPLALSDGKLLVRDWNTLKCVDLK